MEESNIMPSEWVKLCKKKLNRINDCKPPANYPVGKINLKKVQLVRSYFLFINRTKSTVFSFSPEVYEYWNVLFKKKVYLLDCIRTALDTDKRINEKEKAYLILTIKTLEKYDNRFGEKIVFILNRCLNGDVCRYICEYI
jgi:hypothetical protein